MKYNKILFYLWALGLKESNIHNYVFTHKKQYLSLLQGYYKVECTTLVPLANHVRQKSFKLIPMIK